MNATEQENLIVDLFLSADIEDQKANLKALLWFLDANIKAQLLEALQASQLPRGAGGGTPPDRPQAVARSPLHAGATEYPPSGLGCSHTPSGEAGRKGDSLASESVSAAASCQLEGTAPAAPAAAAMPSLGRNADFDASTLTVRIRSRICRIQLLCNSSIGLIDTGRVIHFGQTALPVCWCDQLKKRLRKLVSEWIKQEEVTTPAGAYVRRYFVCTLQACRLFGDISTFVLRPDIAR